MYIRHSPDLLAANYSLREPALKTKTCSSIDRFIMFSGCASSRKTPIFICEDQGRPRWWPLFIKTGKWATGEQLEQPGDDSLLWHCTGRVVPESAVQSAEQYVGRVCVSYLGDTESVLPAFHCLAARLTAYSRIAPPLFVLLHLLSLVLGSFCSFRMQQKTEQN